MPAVTRKVGLPPLILPSEANATAAAPADTTTKASGAAGPSHVRVHRGAAARGAGVERIIRPAAPMAIGGRP